MPWHGGVDQVVDEPLVRDVMLSGARQKTCHHPTRMLVHKRSRKGGADPEVRPVHLIGQFPSRGLAHFERTKHWWVRALGVQPKIRPCVYRCKRPEQRGLSICDGECDGGSGEAEVVEPMSGEGVHSTYDVIPLGDGRGTVSLMRQVGWTRRS